MNSHRLYSLLRLVVACLIIGLGGCGDEAQASCPAGCTFGCNAQGACCSPSAGDCPGTQTQAQQVCPTTCPSGCTAQGACCDQTLQNCVYQAGQTMSQTQTSQVCPTSCTPGCTAEGACCDQTLQNCVYQAGQTMSQTQTNCPDYCTQGCDQLGSCCDVAAGNCPDQSGVLSGSYRVTAVSAVVTNTTYCGDALLQTCNLLARGMHNMQELGRTSAMQGSNVGWEEVIAPSISVEKLSNGFVVELMNQLAGKVPIALATCKPLITAEVLRVQEVKVACGFGGVGGVGSITLRFEKLPGSF